jgi:RimJ/RimL family protein N-acetyltransferase
MAKENPTHAELLSSLKQEFSDQKSGIRLVPLTTQYLLDNQKILTDQWEKFFSDAETKKYLHPMTPFKNNEDGISEKISVSEWLENRAKSQNSVTYIICPDNVRNPIGHLSLNNIDIDKLTANRGMLIGEPEFRGIGIGRNVGLMSIEIARKVGLRKLTADTDINNTVSIANLTRQLGNKKISEDGKRYEFSLNIQ